MLTNKRPECRYCGQCVWSRDGGYRFDGDVRVRVCDPGECPDYEPMPDVSYLADIAEDLRDRADWCFAGRVTSVSADILYDISNKIRDALGAEHGR